MERPFVHPALGEGGWKKLLAPCFVYVIASRRDDRPVKIGVASDVQARIRQFEAGNPYGLYAASRHAVMQGVARQVETRVHKLFAAHALGREWFDVHARHAAEPIPDLCRLADAALSDFHRRMLADPAQIQAAERAADLARSIRRRASMVRAACG